MYCYDGINKRYGNDTLQLAAQGRVEKWQMRREFLSPSFTSKWRDIPKISCSHFVKIKRKTTKGTSVPFFIKWTSKAAITVSQDITF
jgi:hypothetical protein